MLQRETLFTFTISLDKQLNLLLATPWVIDCLYEQNQMTAMSTMGSQYLDKIKEMHRNVQFFSVSFSIVYLLMGMLEFSVAPPGVVKL